MNGESAATMTRVAAMGRYVAGLKRRVTEVELQELRLHEQRAQEAKGS